MNSLFSLFVFYLFTHLHVAFFCIPYSSYWSYCGLGLPVPVSWSITLVQTETEYHKIWYIQGPKQVALYLYLYIQEGTNRSNEADQT